MKANKKSNKKFMSNYKELDSTVNFTFQNCSIFTFIFFKKEI